MNDCLFCKIIKGEIPCHKVYEDNLTFAFLDIGPVSKGHTLIVPKQHADIMQAGSLDDALAIMTTTYQIAPAILKALGATGYNLGMNHGEDAGQDVFHTHLHFMPRYEGDARTFIKQKPSQEELAQVAQLIRQEL
ncbi:MAG: Histidine triad (HIT) protein [Candidatus Uhrbacteria bacterium GW2011_GWD2_41_121]|uniref:Histidine triad (HIT) protein n=1 Tax=Candidatus Uhrbacteria bacterium GW2011_GWC1_41_20 TaxID=1618983 RepID=A0A0G0VFL2_9BACT|nr:MAG: Histidine triad (HIT) protein [Candidatus Uhrbacteria bacterium GW2011_GWE1_39_46]KKR64305.1 MAG: Histidine triad (HIT) protein [Candidatus Uhrbacteria bacterium GW2011_GWC2_40_450]KKR90475.1 MAG: Histidine triad (HIT) protein [Candidatus Uhrbacteria bacterium GW2011_GWD2_41_121]KKR96322.1 MAG: Histidine triad (HIT) protein [Candidatus Uhrbacteria bacterium GW2011_GWD1_41_16]KKR99739.1 MAG: Histidine triad (HIT) protein [Candidatus Uhrbacteria bacterium GW2011_GWC1_41_20]KKS06312.1 MAG